MEVITGEHVCKYCNKSFFWDYKPAEPLRMNQHFDVWELSENGVAHCKRTNSKREAALLLKCYCPHCQTPNAFEHMPSK